jgi:hypothetical protein
MAQGAFTYSPTGSTLTGSADPANAYAASPEFGGVIGAIMADQYARKKQKEDFAQKMALTDQFSRLAGQTKAMEPAPRPMGFGGGGFPRPMAAAAPVANDPIGDQLRQKQQEAAIQALDEQMRPAPTFFNAGPNYLSTGYAGHYAPDVVHMSGAQRSAFLPQGSQFSGAASGATVDELGKADESEKWRTENARRAADPYNQVKRYRTIRQKDGSVVQEEM